MKKKIILILLATACLLTLCFSLIGCTNDKTTVDYSDYSFTGVKWVRDTDVCQESLHFGKNGEFSYSCSCGNPVNDADLIEGYSYDNNTKVITFDAVEVTDDMVKSVTVVSCDGEKLVLDFDGDERVFVTEENYVHTEEVDYNEFSFTNMDWEREIEGCTEIINFGPYGSFSYYCLCRDCKDYSLLADKYTYDSETGIVTLNVIADDAESGTNTIKIVSYDSEKLVVEIDSETIEFVPAYIE
jgi:hypothetical protein